jgi:hypothetical protein
MEAKNIILFKIISGVISDPIVKFTYLFFKMSVSYKNYPDIRSHRFGIMGGHDLFFNVGHTV